MHHTLTRFLAHTPASLTLFTQCEGLPTNPKELAEAVRSHKLTNTEIRALCTDLQVLGRSEFKQLLKWRLQLRKALAADLGASDAKDKAGAKDKAKDKAPGAPTGGGAQESGSKQGRGWGFGGGGSEGALPSPPWTDVLMKLPSSMTFLPAAACGEEGEGQDPMPANHASSSLLNPVK